MGNDLSIGFSPCPNDTFIFHAMIHGRIDTGGIRFRPRIEDVEGLNLRALAAELDVTKLSAGVLGAVRDGYFVLRSGGAMGRGAGPLIVTKKDHTLESLRDRRIAIPGRNTTAFLLLRLYDPLLAGRTVEMPFNEIMPAVSSGRADAGLVIHEGRLTYAEHGLASMLDLGQWWEEETGMPIPLGFIVCRRSLGTETARRVEAMIRASLEYAYKHRKETMPYVRKHAQELSDEVIWKHIGLYVNDFSFDLGAEGEAAIKELLWRAEALGVSPKSTLPIFAE